ncbi:MAG: TonB-dependent receptor [Pseudomonadota bacterium]
MRSADDAFGFSVGNETIGLYSSDDVRGFSPIDAGNVRLNGLSIDQQTGFTDRLVTGSTIRAGLAAQGYLLPAPTGIVDFSLRRVAETPVQSLVIARENYGGYSVAADFQARGASGFWEATGGVGYEYEESGNGSIDEAATMGGTLRFIPSENVDITLFGDYEHLFDDQRWASFFTFGSFTPPEINNPRDYIGQRWVEIGFDNYNFGALTKISANVADIDIGVFRSVTDGDRQVGQFFADVDLNGDANLSAFIGPPQKSASTSLEGRLSRVLTEGPRAHAFTLNVRAREREKTFGGATNIDLGPININKPVFFPRPNVLVGDATEESVEQVTVGLAYDVRWASVGELNLGVQQTDYTRTIARSSEAVAEGTSDPIMFNATGSAELTPRLVAYGGFVRGFEEGPIAPGVAVNRNEAPAAIETEQADFGVRLFVGDLTAVAGVFQLEKPFFGLGDDMVFRETGTIVNRGVELSLAGSLTDQLQMVLGAVFFDPKLEGVAVDQGLLSADPIAFRNRKITLDVDYRPVWAPGWSFDLSLLSLGEQNGDQLGLLKVDSFTNLDLGFRKQVEVAGTTLVLRGRAFNVFDSFGWEAQSSGGFFYQDPRTFSLSLGADF